MQETCQLFLKKGLTRCCVSLYNRLMKTKHKTKSAKAAVMQTKFRPRVERDRKKYNRKVEKVAILGYN